jgi:hypothetical protein
VTLEAKGPHVGEVALAAAFHYRHDVVGVPQIAAAAPIFFELPASAVIELALVTTQRFGVDAALPTHSAIAREHMLA